MVRTKMVKDVENELSLEETDEINWEVDFNDRAMQSEVSR